MGVSQCCNAELKLEYRIEQLHGKDDDYELKVPFYICSQCGQAYSPAYDPPGYKQQEKKE